MSGLRKPCLVCGTPGPDSWCGEHRPIRPRRKTQYNRAWNKLSRAARAAQPWCSVPGCLSTDLTADHVIPLGKGGELLPDPMDVVVLCRSHNSAKKDR
jgi:5-methylcytosine-specific restriction endonuclease McrA